MNIQCRKICPEEFACQSFIVEIMDCIHAGSLLLHFLQFPNIIFRMCYTKILFVSCCD